MVAQRRRIIAQRIHRRDHRMRMQRPARSDRRRGFGQIIAQRGAVQEVTIVKQQALRLFGAGGVDQAGSAGKADLRAGLIGVVIPGQQMRVQIAGGQNAQVQHWLCGLNGSERRQSARNFSRHSIPNFRRFVRRRRPGCESAFQQDFH
ncbi:MAG: hypothetical protein ACD_54C01114G0001 [uncultured bacterium]|nr:MAG: hypothetical protein ACD_54C01114G0001 [uncultured bacterium]